MQLQVPAIATSRTMMYHYRMCTRFFINKDEPAFQPIIQAAERSPLYEQFLLRAGKRILTEGEIRPTDIVPVIASSRSGKPSAYPMRWGIHMADMTPLFNARAEAGGVKPFFQKDWERRRCIVPASFYFEWNPQKDKFAIQPAGSTITWLCGLYRFEEDLPYFVVLTRDPSDDLRKIHDRMPLILPEEKINEWIRPETDPSQLLPYALTDMVCEHVG